MKIEDEGGQPKELIWGTDPFIPGEVYLSNQGNTYMYLDEDNGMVRLSNGEVFEPGRLLLMASTTFRHMPDAVLLVRGRRR